MTTADFDGVARVYLWMERLAFGRALERGLAASWHDVVARMDADDIAMPQRFAVQLPVIEEGAGTPA